MLQYTNTKNSLKCSCQVVVTTVARKYLKSGYNYFNYTKLIFNSIAVYLGHETFTKQQRSALLTIGHV